MPFLKYHEIKGNVMARDGVLVQCMSSSIEPVTLLDRAINDKYHNYDLIKKWYPNLVWDDSPKVIFTPGVVNLILKKYNNEEIAVARFTEALIGIKDALGDIGESADRQPRLIFNRRAISNFYDWNEWDKFATAIREVFGMCDIDITVVYEDELMSVEIREDNIPGVDINKALYDYKLSESGLGKEFY